jgi:type IV secretory pathway TraG/TraD family ATPase VirD4
MAQDFSQMVAGYGKEIADVVIANLNNQFYGRVSSAITAKHVSELFGREDKRMQSLSRGRNRHDKGESRMRPFPAACRKDCLCVHKM